MTDNPLRPYLVKRIAEVEAAAERHAAKREDYRDKIDYYINEYTIATQNQVSTDIHLENLRLELAALDRKENTDDEH